jgi:hypothetical protein
MEPVVYLAASAGNSDVSTILLAVFGGAVGAALLGLFGAWLVRRDEHKKWVRQERLKAYLKYATLVRQIDTDTLEPQLMTIPGHAQRMMTRFLEEFPPIQTALDIVGPQSLVTAGENYHGAVAVASSASMDNARPDRTADVDTDELTAKVDKTRRIFLDEARRVIGFDAKFRLWS